jgi:hypothetical protein
MSLPDFLIVGAPKAGTTALHVALAAHPQVFMSTPKEPKYFLTDDGVRPVARGGPGDAQTIRRQVWRRQDYEALFRLAPEGTRRGESTVLYLHDRRAHKRIAATLPGARLVAVLRDPIDRAHSNWTHLRSAGLEPEADFGRACALEAQRAYDGWAPFWRYLSLGRYGEQLEHLFSVFPREQVLVLFYRDLREDPVATLDRVCAFLGIETGIVTEVPAANVTVESSRSWLNDAISRVLRQGSTVGQWMPERLRATVSGPVVRALQREQRPRIPLLASQREQLIPQMEDDIARVERLMGVDLSHWRDARYGRERRVLSFSGPIGTGHRSIDRPTGHRRSG